MTDPIPPATLCERCGIRPATRHLCHGSEGASAWCEVCLASADPLAYQITAEAENATCHFCGGGPPCAGGPDSLAGIIGAEPRMLWMCMPCSTEYHSYVRDALGETPADMPREMQMEHLAKIYREVETHMSEFVRRRDP